MEGHSDLEDIELGAQRQTSEGQTCIYKIVDRAKRCKKGEVITRKLYALAKGEDLGIIGL